MVYLGDVDHQQCHHAGDHPAWRRANSRTRARHHGPPPGHATDRIRNRNGEGVGEWLGDYHRCRAFALRRRPHVHAGLLTHEYAVRQQYPARKYAPVARNGDAGIAINSFRVFAQAILYRGAGIDVIWPEFVIVALIGGLFFALAILRFRSVAA